MVRSLLLAAWSALYCSSAFSQMVGAPGSPQMPFTFVENRGQADARVKVVGSGPRFRAFFENDGVEFEQGGAALQVEFAGAGKQPSIRPIDPLGASANYLHGNDPARWQTNLPLYKAVFYDGVWPGVGVTFRQDASRMEAEYTLAPGTDVGEIRLRFAGDVRIEADGSLLVRSKTGEFREKKPVFYQSLPSGRTVIPGGFAKTKDGLVGFHADYDHSRTLVIDPTILFSGFFGGTSQDNITAVAVSSSFNVIVAGWTNSIDLPTSSGAQKLNGGGVDAFVADFSPVGGALVYCTYIGGSGDDRAFGVAVDGSNNVYVTGWTSSVNFPVHGSLQSFLDGARDAFVAKLNPAGNFLVYSTYLGGAGVDTGNAIAVDSLGEAVIVGDTTSLNLPATAGAFRSASGGGQDVFVARLAASGGSLSFLTYFGGNSTDHGATVQIDPTGPIVIGGGTMSTNLPVLLAAQPHSGGLQDGFVAKFNSTATALVFSTYLGGSGGSPGFPEEVNSLMIGPSRNIVAAGITSSTNFPTTSTSLQPAYGGGQTDGFITKLNGTTGAIMASTFLGGTLNDGINAVAGDQLGRIYVTGFTISTDFPVARPTQGASAGGSAGSMDAFVVTINSGVNQMNFGTYLGGSGSDAGNAIVVDSMTSIIVAGQTGSPDFPVAGGSIGSFMTEGLSSFVTKLAPDWTLSVASEPSVMIDTWHIAGYNGTVSAATTYAYGQYGDIPVAGDWTGSGVKRIGVFRNGIWILDANGDGILNAGDKVVIFGQSGDIPIVGDWTGTGTIKLGLYRAGTFILDLSGHLSGIPTGVADATFPFGLSTDIPVVGDWNTTGTIKVGVFRNGSWLIDYNGDRVFNALDKTYTYGQSGDIPVTGYWDSSGVVRIGVYRAGYFILNYSGSNSMGTLGQTELYFAFGSAGMTPVSR